MITLLSKILIRQEDEKERRGAYGVLCSIVGICLNILLFVIKFIAGYVSGSVAITADAFNNLSDAGSSVVALLGFWFAGREPDAEHPFGHGRYEYIAGFIVSIAILLMGFQLLQNSILKIIHPEEVSGDIYSIIILLISIVVKIYMYAYNRDVGRKIKSTAMLAVAKDSISDVVATSIVLLAVLIQKYAGINLDGFGGVIVAFFILYSGYEAAKETIDPLLGLPPDPHFVKQVEEIVLSHDMMLGIHDLVVHDYGPDQRMISLHVEVPGDKNMFEVHDMVDHVEHELKEVLNCESVIHMDPVMVDDEKANVMKSYVLREIKSELDERISIHDFRMAECEGHTNLMFDVVVPYDVKMKEKEIKRRIEGIVSEINNGNLKIDENQGEAVKYRAVVDVDRCEVR